MGNFLQKKLLFRVDVLDQVLIDQDAVWQISFDLILVNTLCKVLPSLQQIFNGNSHLLVSREVHFSVALRHVKD